ncbi:MAG: hypothetical protein K2H53_00665 [Clostridia bacterium]|nr:hypothetical protein [Clostridia bacterium]
MKKRIRISTLLVVILAFFMPEVAYAKGGKVLPKYYKEMIEGIDWTPVCIFDSSWSMTHTFSYEKEIIEYNLSETEFEKNYTLMTSEIWLEVNKIAQIYNKIVLVSDLWDISEEMLKPASNKTLVVVVPFWSDDKEAVNHIDDVVWDEILTRSSWTDSTVVIIYLDGLTGVYDN